MIASISTDVIRVIYLVLNPLLLLLSSGLIATSLVVTLLAIDWVIALGTALLVFLVYSAVIARSQMRLQLLGRQQALLNQRLIQVLQEGLGGIRDVLLNGHQSFYGNLYRLARSAAEASQCGFHLFLSTYPRLVIEPVGMALIAIAGYLLVRQQGVDQALPLLGAWHWVPNACCRWPRRFMRGWAQSRSAKASLAAVLQLLDQPLPAESRLSRQVPLTLVKSISLEGAHFRYGPDLPEVLKGLDLEIHRGERIGLIGSTGSGKEHHTRSADGLIAAHGRHSSGRWR